MAHLRPMHRTLPPQFFSAFADTFVATLRARVPDLPEFVLAASGVMLRRAAEQIAAT
jgi:hypothetical protein